MLLEVVPLLSTLHIALVGDYCPDVIAHQAIPRALDLVAQDQEVPLSYQWLHTSTLNTSSREHLLRAHGVWCVPASPYADTLAVLAAIRRVRESGVPYLGTCGGFQHALLEYAQNVLQLTSAAHAELDPEARHPLIAPLACSLVEQSGRISLSRNSRLANAYGTTEIEEGYHCSYGLSRGHEHLFERGALAVVGRDAAGEVRAVELANHPFFVATLFQPERAALRGVSPPPVKAFVAACAVAASERAPI